MFFFFNDTATTEIYTLSLHDALPISANTLALARLSSTGVASAATSNARAAPIAKPLRTPDVSGVGVMDTRVTSPPDRKSTRLNSSHANISYAVFCLKKKKQKQLVLTI